MNNLLTKKIPVALLFAFLLLIPLMLLSGCGNEPAEDVAEFQELITAEGQNSLELIEQAVAERKITYETSLLYKMYAVFGDDRLPAEYQSDKKFRNSDDVIKEVRFNMGKLSKKTQDELAPFFRRPDDPESYFNIKYRDAVPDEQAGLIPAAYAARPAGNLYTDFYESDNGKVKIWYPNATTTTRKYSGSGNMQVTSSTAKGMAEKITKYFDDDDIMERFYDLLQRNVISDGTRGGDSRLDIYVAPAGGDLGLTYCESSPSPCSSYILINTNIGLSRDKILKTTVAHETFHAFQYAYKYKEPADDWWSEATAVWSEDFIYPGANTEQGWLYTFIPYPQTKLHDQNNPSSHHYGAYIFPYYLSESSANDSFMKASWESCETQSCLKAVNAVIDGGYEKQWKEFTMWNYNKDPVKYYSDVGGFSDKSSEDGQNTGQTMIIGDEEQPVEIDELNPLSAHVHKAINIANEEEVKKLTFKDFDTFTGLSEKAGIKAIIYYENGRKEVEDWTDKQERSFCIENPNEDFEHIIFIFSNAEMEDAFAATNISVEGKDNCYNIDQKDFRTAVVHFPTSDGVVNIGTTIQTDSMGEPSEKAQEDQPYAYLTKWQVKNEFEQIKESFQVSCDGSPVTFDAGWTTRAATILHFDLGPEGLNEDGTFSIDMEYGGFKHPKGNYEEAPSVDIPCANAFVSASTIDMSNVHFTMEDIWTGRIYDMTEDGAKIEIPNSCLYHNCTMQNGAPFQDISEPVILEIKKWNN